MNKQEISSKLRARLAAGGHTLGSWIQIPNSSIAEILGDSGYDWVAIDLEHGSINTHQLPDLFRAISLGGTLPFARLAQGHSKDCKQALDAGAAGIIVPSVSSAEQLATVRDACCWPPAGKRGVGFSRANLFGRYFEEYREFAQSPFLVAMIETMQAVDALEEILSVSGLDAILIGPYDLSASMGITGQFSAPEFVSAMERILEKANAAAIPCGVHVVDPDPSVLAARLRSGYRFIAYSIDAVFLEKSCKAPIV
jgi:2-dehydro-3-deoxyglucarate aldolase